jgi:hypothetical protein
VDPWSSSAQQLCSQQTLLAAVEISELVLQRQASRGTAQSAIKIASIVSN